MFNHTKLYKLFVLQWSYFIVLSNLDKTMHVLYLVGYTLHLDIISYIKDNLSDPGVLWSENRSKTK